MTKTSCILLSALVGAFLLMSAQPSHSAEMTVDLGECNMFSPDFTECLVGIAFPTVELTDEPLWIDFTLFGEPDAHIVTEEDTLWSITIGTSSEFAAPFPTLTLTDMGGAIPGLQDIDPTDCDPFGAGGLTASLCSYDIFVAGNTFVHDLHFDQFNGTSIAPGFLFIDTNGIEHEKGLWVPEPATATLVVFGLFGLTLRRRRHG